MKVAVASNSSGDATYASQCVGYICYTIDKGIVTTCRNLPNITSSPSQMVHMLGDLGFDAVIALDYEDQIAQQLSSEGIEAVISRPATVRQAAMNYVSHTLFGDEDDESSDDNDLDEA
ncbi:MAG: hypothetical protein LUB61_07100, partial [Eggerthellaceae bacterium]|nr:hypothetical protein [Eggerthellaceae bacterium]